MLATCVKMQTYTLARYRQLKPAPPFHLGGVFVRMEGRGFLKDAQNLMAIIGDFESLRDGDLIQVEVTGEGNSGWLCVNVKRVQAATSQRARVPKPHAPRFTDFIYRVRQYFLDRGLTEVFTPSLVVCPGLEPSLEPFKVGQHYLPTSPEIHLKKAMAEGFTDLFEIKPCFRDKESSPHHAAEFLMLEWYRGFANLDLVIEDLSGLLTSLRIAPFETTTFKELFKTNLDFDLTPQTPSSELKSLCQAHALDIEASDTWSDFFHRLTVHRIEPVMAQRSHPVLVRDFPPSEAALARLNSKGWADRFELYWRGFEIANAFNEVTDAPEQVRRWQYEQSERKRLGTSPLPQDSTLIEALEKGIPPTAGIALGLERLYMALNGVDDIRELRLF